MVVRKSGRLEVRLSPEDRAFLDETLCQRGESLSAWVRQKVDEERASAAIARRVAAAERLNAMNFDWGSTDWAEIKKEIVESDDDAWM